MFAFDDSSLGVLVYDKGNFVAFKELHRVMTDAAIAESLLEELRALGLNLDGSGAMAGCCKQYHPSTAPTCHLRSLLQSCSEPMCC